VKIFILAGKHHVAETLAYHLRMPRGWWAFATAERDLCGYERALVIEESDTAHEHPNYVAIMRMIEANGVRFHVSPISLDWILGLDRRSHMKLGRPTEFRGEHQNAPMQLETDPTVPPGTALVERAERRVLGRLTNLGE
jgi:hypothetical protein